MQYISVDAPKILVVPGDIHAPNQDNLALSIMTSAAVDVARRLGVGRDELELCLVGDTFNSSGFSPHPSVRRLNQSVEDEKEAIGPWINTWKAHFGTIRVLCGNHEAWQEHDAALRDSPWSAVYGDLLESGNTHVYSEGARLVYGGRLVVCHGHDLRGANTEFAAEKVLKEYPGQNTLFGHIHRLQSSTTPTIIHGKPVVHGAWSVGMMCTRESETEDRFMRKFSDRHQQGFALVYFSEGTFKVELCEVLSDGSAAYAFAAGVRYSGVR